VRKKPVDQRRDGPEPIGTRVRRLRLERGIAQEHLSIEAHVDQSGLSKFERGARNLGEVPLRRVANVLGLSFEDLISGSDFEPSHGRRPQPS